MSPDRRGTAGSRAGRFRARDGFTLIEALAALTVLAAVSPALFRVAVMVRAGTEAVDDHTRSEIVARSLLDASLARPNFDGVPLSGVTDGRRWTVTVRPLPEEAAPPVPAEPRGAAAPGGPPTQARETKPEAAPPWIPVGVSIRVETAGRPLAVETVTLVRRGEP